MNENCRYNELKSCQILKKLYCKLEPDKKCSFYKKRTAEHEKDKSKL